jgi:gamma-glutamyl-gamma-aminobutyrate hydrolase PuuD
LVDKVEDADIVLFTGGEDVDPSLYDCEKHSTTHSNIRRDLREKAIFEKVRPDQACIGICRGSQFLCVMNGGKLVQKVGGHAMFGTHEIRSFTRSANYDITSTHHQMQYPFNLGERNYEVLYASSRRSDFYEGDGIEYYLLNQK